MLKPAAWLKQFRRVEQITWAPGRPEIIEDELISDGGWKARPGAHGLNLYQSPTIVPGNATQAGPWIEHLATLYPEDAEDIANWCAHRVQHPDIKINHALVMGGGQGIGKDWLLQALKMTVGAWNFHEISPPDLLTPYTPHVKSVVLRINEAHDLGDSLAPTAMRFTSGRRSTRQRRPTYCPASISISANSMSRTCLA
jgi:hypothetical protein